MSDGERCVTAAHLRQEGHTIYISGEGRVVAVSDVCQRREGHTIYTWGEGRVVAVSDGERCVDSGSPAAGGSHNVYIG